MMATTSRPALVLVLLYCPALYAGGELLAAGNARYHLLQGEPGAAYVAALRAERRSSEVGDQDVAETTAEADPPAKKNKKDKVAKAKKQAAGVSVPVELALIRAAAALELGWFVEARRFLEQLAAGEVGVLNPSQEASAYLTMARFAYNTGNVAALDRALAELQVAQASAGSKRRAAGLGAGSRFLAVELQRMQGDLAAASALIREIPRGNVLHRYASLNLGLAAIDEDPGLALQHLTSARKGRARDDETREIMDRARVGLAGLASRRGESDQARRILGEVGSGEVAATAISLLADSATANGAWDESARLWYFLMTEHGTRDVSLPAFIGYPYALEQTVEPAVAFGGYEASATLLRARRESLAQADQEIAALSEEELVTLVTRREAEGNAAPAGAEAVWVDWMAADQTVAAVRRFVHLRNSREILQVRLEGLVPLREVAAEQQQRAGRVASRLPAVGAARVADLAVHEQQLRGQLNAALARADTSAFATAAEAETLSAVKALQDEAARLRTLSQRAGLAEAVDSSLDKRTRRMQGVTEYRIAAEMPARAEARAALLDAAAVNIGGAQTQVDRIKRAATHTVGQAGALARVAALEGQTQALLSRTDGALIAAREALRDGLRQQIGSALAAVRMQEGRIHLAMARIADQQLGLTNLAPVIPRALPGI